MSKPVNKKQRIKSGYPYVINGMKRPLLHLTLLTIVMALSINCKEDKNIPVRDTRPNILFLMSDNHSWNHLGCYGNKVLKTPNIDKLANEGVMFMNAHCASPSCSPARSAMLTGQDIWRLEQAANLWSSFPDVTVYTRLLENAGYTVGAQGKAWGPGDFESTGWKTNPGGQKFDSFEEFQSITEKDKPWIYWFTSDNPRRPYFEFVGKESNINIENIEVPPYLPDNEAVRGDIAEYYHKVELFDKEVASFIELVAKAGDLENTIIVVCGDNGWQMPRGLANLYDFGTKVPLIISWPNHFMGDRKVTDLVSLNDLAPTFLELAGVAIPDEMTANSLMDILSSDKTGRLDPDRKFLVTARERHAYARQGGTGYPGRAIHMDDHLYIRNYAPDLWPAGDPPLYGDVDAHMLQYSSPTKMFMLLHKNEKEIKPLFEMAFGKRPGEELFDLSKDPYQLHNVADEQEYADIKAKLSKQLTEYLVATGDPRETDADIHFEAAEYFKEGDKYPEPSKEAIEVLGLEEQYNYVDE